MGTRRRVCRLYVLIGGLTVVVVWTWIILSIHIDSVTNKRHASIRETVKRSIQEFDSSFLHQARRKEDIQAQLAELALSVHRAKLHARGTKTSDYLRTALEKLDNLLDNFEVNKTVLYKRRETNPTNVCPEKYMGSTYGYPFFYKGFEETACSFGKPLSDLVTVILIDVDNRQTIRHTAQFVHSAVDVYPNIPIIIWTRRGSDLHDLRDTYRSLTLVENTGYLADGAILNDLVKMSKTPYVLVVKESDILTTDSRLSRLVGEFESLGVSAVGGAWREPTGHWSHGCFQSVNRNFTLKYVYGYDESFHECIFCDHVTGPFLSSRRILTEYPFKAYDVDNGLFEEWFLRLKHKNEEVIVCPDSMFHIRPHTAEADMSRFMGDMNLHEVHTVDGRTIKGRCDRKYYKQKSKSLSPCSLKSNSVLVKFIMDLCEEKGIICELQEGTSLGAVKFGKVLPWERDADLTFLSSNFSVLQGLKGQFLKEHMSFHNSQQQWCCADNRTAGGVFTISAFDWTVEMYGQHIMDSETLTAKGIAPTKVSFDGHWVNVPRNPGLFVRNRYGREVYQHALHWMTTGARDGWAPYKTNVFIKCSNPGDHDCLDRYNADGSLTFEYILP